MADATQAHGANPIPAPLEELVIELLEGPDACLGPDLTEILRHYPDAAAQITRWLGSVGVELPAGGDTGEVAT